MARAKAHMSEKEAIERGIIKAPAKEEQPSTIYVPVYRKQHTSVGFRGVMLFVVGWLIGFVFGLGFHG